MISKTQHTGGRLNRILGLTFLGVAIAALPVVALASGVPELAPADFAAAIEVTRDSMVVVESTQADPAGVRESLCMTNSGFFVSQQGHVVTSVLAVSGCTRVLVRTSDGREAEARLRALHQPSGLALLETDLKDTVPLEFSPEPPQAGRRVLGAYSSRSSEGRVTVGFLPGILSSCRASVKIAGQRWGGLLESDLQVGPGCAAGPILDEQGRLLGVMFGASSRGGVGAGCCYGLPAGKVKAILSDLFKGRTRRQSWLGLAVARADRVQGLLVRGVFAGSPSDVAGVRRGDVLVEIDGAPITGPLVFEKKVAAMEPGSEIRLRLRRGGRLKTLRVQVGARPLLISRGRLDTARSLRLVGLPAPPVMPDLVSRQLIIELERQNRELREHIRRLEQRIERLERAWERRGKAQD